MSSPGQFPPPPSPYQPQPQAPKKRHRVRTTLLAIAGLFVALVIIGALAGGGKNNTGNSLLPNPTPTPAAAVAAPSSPAATSAAGVTVTRTVDKVIFKVWGSAPSGADITYGSDSDTNSPQGGLGLDGSGEALPWSGSITYHASALYWSIDAQLQGSGNIHCEVGLKVTKYFSDGTHVSRSKILQRGHASGGYNICTAQENND